MGTLEMKDIKRQRKELGNCETSSKYWLQQVKGSVKPDLYEVDVDNKRHENKADKDICRWNGIYRYQIYFDNRQKYLSKKAVCMISYRYNSFTGGYGWLLLDISITP